MEVNLLVVKVELTPDETNVYTDFMNFISAEKKEVLGTFVDTLHSFFDNEITLQQWFLQVERLLGPEGFLCLKSLFYKNNVSPSFIDSLLQSKQQSTTKKQPSVQKQKRSLKSRQRVHRKIRVKKQRRDDGDYVEKQEKVRLRNSPQYWTQEESDKLKQLVKENPKEGWVQIAKLLGTGKTGAQCSQRWSRVIAPTLTKKPWTAEEEERLIELHEVFGKMWAHIASQLPGRSDIQCRHRYLKLKESQNLAWTECEDRALLEEAMKQPQNKKDWQKVSEALILRFGKKKRTVFRWPINCKRRYFELLKENDQLRTSSHSQGAQSTRISFLCTDEVLNEI